MDGFYIHSNLHDLQKVINVCHNCMVLEASIYFCMYIGLIMINTYYTSEGI